MPHRGPLAPLLLLSPVLLLSACGPLSGEGSLGGASPPPAGSLSISFIDVGQGDGILVQAGEESYLIDAGRAEEGPNVVDFLRIFKASLLRQPVAVATVYSADDAAIHERFQCAKLPRLEIISVKARCRVCVCRVFAFLDSQL